jgi:LacI family transcriptional regulator
MKPTRGRVTQADIAAETGVSRAAVCAVLTGRTQGIHVGASTRERILAVARRLGYRTHAAARQLRLGRSRVVGLVADDLTLPFLGAVVQSVVTELRKDDYSCLLIELGRASAAGAVGEWCRQAYSCGKVDAILLAGATGQVGDDELRSLVSDRIPVVLVERRMTDGSIPSVAVDNVLGGRLAAGHLLGERCRSIGLIGGPADNAMSKDRLDGARAACRAAGVALPAARIAKGDWSLESGRAAMERLLKRTPGLEGVFAANDLMAIGAMAALRDRVCRVPQDVAVVGYDDTPLARYVHPELTSVRQPAEAMGRNAARLVLAALGCHVAPIETLIPELVVRASSLSEQKRERAS